MVLRSVVPLGCTLVVFAATACFAEETAVQLRAQNEVLRARILALEKQNAAQATELTTAQADKQTAVHPDFTARLGETGYGGSSYGGAGYGAASSSATKVVAKKPAADSGALARWICLAP